MNDEERVMISLETDQAIEFANSIIEAARQSDGWPLDVELGNSESNCWYKVHFSGSMGGFYPK